MSYGVYIVHNRHSPISMRLCVRYSTPKCYCKGTMSDWSHMEITHNTHVCCDDGICCNFLIRKLDEVFTLYETPSPLPYSILESSADWRNQFFWPLVFSIITHHSDPLQIAHDFIQIRGIPAFFFYLSSTQPTETKHKRALVCSLTLSQLIFL